MGRFGAKFFALFFLHVAFSARAAVINNCPTLLSAAAHSAASVQTTTQAAATQSKKSFLGITVTKRTPNGDAAEGSIRVLAGDANDKIYVVGPFNNWGAAKTAEDQLHSVDGRYFEGKVRSLSHGMEYRLEVNGKTLVDPASATNTVSGHLNSIFWDFDRAGGYKMKNPGVNLKGKAKLAPEVDPAGIVAQWNGGPKQLSQTYQYTANSGVIAKFKEMVMGNLIRFLPVGSSGDGANWQSRYLPFTQWGIDTRWGSPDDLMKMIDKFHEQKLGVTLDLVAAHYTERGNGPLRDLGQNALAAWKRADGSRMFGNERTAFDTLYYDFSDTHVQDYLLQGTAELLRRYHFDYVRLDHLEGIAEKPGGRSFLQRLSQMLDKDFPTVDYEGETFKQHYKLEAPVSEGGLGFRSRTHGEWAFFLRDNIQRNPDEINMNLVRDSLRKPITEGEPIRTSAFTNHDEAANYNGGASGQFMHSLVTGFESEKKIQTWDAMTMFSTSNAIDLPQTRLMQKGSFNTGNAINWALAADPKVAKNTALFKDLSKYYLEQPAFGPNNISLQMENHIDYANKVVSILRQDKVTGKRIYGIFNLSGKSFDNYAFGVEGKGPFKLVIDNNAPRYGDGNTGKLTQALGPSQTLTPTAVSTHGKSETLTVPFLGSNSFAIFEVP